MDAPLISARVDAAPVVEAYRRYARALGKDVGRCMKRALMNWAVKAQDAMRREGFGKTSRFPNLPLPGDRSRGKWRLVSWLVRERSARGLAVAATRSEASRKEVAARRSSKGFLRWMTVAAARAAKAAYRASRDATGAATARTARGIVATATGRIGGKAAEASLSSVFEFRVPYTRAMKPQSAESARRRIESAFAYVVPEVVRDTENYVARELARRAGKERIA